MSFWDGSTDQDVSLTDQLLKISNAFSNEMDRQSEGNNRALEQTGKLISGSMTREQLDNATNALNNMSSRANMSGENNVNQQIIKNQLDNRKAAFNDYESALEEFADYRKSDSYFEDTPDWLNVDNIRTSDRFLDDNGQPLFDNNLTFLTSEFGRLKSIGGRIAAGAESKFRVKPGKTINGYSDTELTTELEMYQGRLQSAVEAALGNVDEIGIITPNEAALIMGGDVAVFREQRDRIVATVKEQIKESNNDIDTIDGFIRRGANQTDSFTDMFGLSASDFDANGQITEGGMDKVNQERNIAHAERNMYLTKYKGWTGFNYGGVDTSTKSFMETQTETESIDDVEDLTEEAWSSIDEEIENKDKAELVQRYGTSDPKKIKGIIEEQVEFERNNISVDKFKEMGGMDGLVKGIQDGTVSEKGLKDFVTVATDGRLNTDGLFKDIPKYIRDMYEELGINPPSSIFDANLNPPTLESLEAAYFEANPDADPNDENVRRAVRLNLQHGVLSQGVLNDIHHSSAENVSNFVNEYANMPNDKAYASLQNFIIGDTKSMMKASIDATPDRINNKRVKMTQLRESVANKIMAFKNKFQKAKKNGISLEQFIKENEEEFHSMAITLKYSRVSGFPFSAKKQRIIQTSKKKVKAQSKVEKSSKESTLSRLVPNSASGIILPMPILNLLEPAVKNLVSRSPKIQKILGRFISKGLISPNKVNELIKNMDLESLIDKPYKLAKAINESLNPIGKK